MKFKIGSVCIMNGEVLAVITGYADIYTLRWVRQDINRLAVFTHSESDLARWNRDFGRIILFKDYIDAV